MANYSKREERRAQTARAMEDYVRRPPPGPPIYACEVCDIEKGDGVPIWALSERGRHRLLCAAHIPAEWMPTPEEIERASRKIY